MGHLADRRRVLKVGPDGSRAAGDLLAVEEPLTVRVDAVDVVTTMRTPGHDLDLALGWLVAEGVAVTPADVVEAIACNEDTVDVRLRPGVVPPAPRLTPASSACGICGTDAIADVLGRRGGTLDPRRPTVELRVLLDLPAALRAAQATFDRTGGLHAAGLFTASGEALCVREDVGRHNAVDKVVGWALREGHLPGSDLVLQVSGRASFELTQKAAMAGVPVLSAVSAPSSLAVDLAREVGLTLVGFVRSPRLNVYAGAERITGVADLTA